MTGICTFSFKQMFGDLGGMDPEALIGTPVRGGR